MPLGKKEYDDGTDNKKKTKKDRIIIDHMSARFCQILPDSASSSLFEIEPYWGKR